MKTFLKIITILVITFFSTTVINAQETEEAFYARGGFSDVTGFVAGEYMSGQFGFSFGWHKYSPNIANQSKSSIDIAVTYYGDNYEENCFYVSAGYASTNAVKSINGDAIEWAGTTVFTGGYKISATYFDLKLGGGYLYSSIVNGPAIDVSVGIKLF